MRGKRGIHRGLHVALRIIPAHAGQTGYRPHHGRRHTDHPRACGANQSLYSVVLAMSGSSPRMRGKLLGAGGPAVWGRIIPAHAGQTPTTRAPTRTCSDHPRTCGANAPNTVFLMPRTGSSPHMRGKLSDSRPPPQSPRIIPAHAGQTSNPRRKSWKPTDHPRICGANVDSAVQSNPPDGSSPHMRGKLTHPCERVQHARIIPAHAGQTCVCA